MSDWQEKIYLFHYNIWRFERWTRRLVFSETKLASIQVSPDEDEELDDSNPFAVHNELPNYTGKHFSILVFLVLFTIVNFARGFFEPLPEPAWPWGVAAGAAASVLLSLYLAPTERRKYLENFKRFELMSTTEKRKSGVISLFIVVGIWALAVAALFTPSVIEKY